MNFAPLLLLFNTHLAVQAKLPPILPKPVAMRMLGGPGFEVRRGTVVVNPNGTQAVNLLESLCQRGMGYRLREGESAGSQGAIQFIRVPHGSFKEGQYRLHVGRAGVKIWFGDKGGAVYAVETLRQLLPVAIEGPKPSPSTHWTIPAINVDDYPRFSWRGLHLDVSRHFFPAAFIEKYIGYIAMLKMNTFHWHLVDDGGWRLEIKRYPKLTSVGAWRYGITTGWDQSKLRFDPQSGLPKYGGFYTQQQVKEIVKVASDLNVNVVPEIEMPGHTMPVFAAYPDLECKNQPPAEQAGQPRSNVYCAGNEATYKFVENVLDEVMALFPSKWIHIGGDEVDKEYWHRCPICQAKMKKEGLKNEDQLQSYFVQRIDKYLASKGRRLIGWDEILEGGLAKGATVMSWRGIDGGIAAAKAGHDVVMTPGSHLYFDASYEGQPTEHVYTFEPIPPGLTPEQGRHVLGAQANVWCERIPTTQRVEYMIFPRIAAVSEVDWSPKAGRDTNEFLGRLASLFPRLDRLGASYYVPAPRLPMSAYLFDGKAHVAATVDRGLGVLRYTLDGSKPNGSSPAYAGPIEIENQTIVKLAYVTPSGSAGDVAEVACVPSTNESLTNPVSGWQASYYEGTWNTVPDFSKLTPVKSDFLPKMGLGMRVKEENFGFDFKGYFKAEKSGVYRFALSSDDGSWLTVGGAKVVDNDGPHPLIAREGNVWLPAGLHKIEVGYFQGGGAFGLSLKVQPPGAGSLGGVDRYVFCEH